MTEHTFTYSVAPKDAQVFIAGSFNNWEKIKMQVDNEIWYYKTTLSEGDHEYKFIVNDEWVCDQNEPITVTYDGFVNNKVFIVKPVELLDTDYDDMPNMTDMPISVESRYELVSPIPEFKTVVAEIEKATEYEETQVAEPELLSSEPPKELREPAKTKKTKNILNIFS
jgi:hypothetical protein